MHDTVIPEIRALSYIPFKNPGAAVGDEVNARCDAVIGRLRDICHALIPPDFNNLLLTESLTGLCEAFQKRSGIECRLVAADDLRLSPLTAEAQLQCYRIIQEALENIERHSHASEASVVPWLCDIQDRH
ncbi:hypothetical protein AGMMS49944_01880 [Spirochaetia bacterium]|nr:hypothetical protein AGMMS49944_01880 [Spirochaetia bacterium]